MNHAPAIRILAIIGLLAAGATTMPGTAAAQTPAERAPTWQSPSLRPVHRAAATGENRLQILGTRSLPGNTAGAIRVVQDEEPSPAEPIGPGVKHGKATATPPSAANRSTAPGNYEAVDAGWKPIGAVSASIVPAGDQFPADLAAARFAQAGQVVAPVNENHDWPTLSYSWEASAVGHNPLYFEDANLERYGYSHGILQPLISGGRFFTTVVFLPYKIVAHPPHEIIYPLGYYRPGDPAPPVREIEPIKLSAAAVEAAFVVGMVIILP